MTRTKHDQCKFQRKEYFDEPLEDEAILRHPYYSCTLDIENVTCPFPQRYCRFKDQNEDADQLIAAANGEITTERPE